MNAKASTSGGLKQGRLGRHRQFVEPDHHMQSCIGAFYSDPFAKHPLQRIQQCLTALPVQPPYAAHMAFIGAAFDQRRQGCLFGHRRMSVHSCLAVANTSCSSGGTTR